MKKAVALVAGLVLAFGLVACGGTTNTPATTEQAASVETASSREEMASYLAEYSELAASQRINTNMNKLIDAMASGDSATAKTLYDSISEDADGQPQMNEVAKKKAQEILNDYKPTPLDKDVQDELNAIVAEGAK